MSACPSSVMRLTGHRNFETVIKFYREVPQRDVEEAVRALDGGDSRLEVSGTQTA